MVGIDASRDRPAGTFHQIDAGDPARHRQAVGRGHFSGG
jgi:hypothetical protein